MRSTALSERELAAIKAEALEALRQWRTLSPAQVTQRVTAAIAETDLQVKFCTYIMTLFFAILNSRHDRSVSLVCQMMRETPGVEMKLAMFVGIVSGMAIEGIEYGVSEQLIGLLGRFLKALIELPEAEKAMLAGFLDEALSEVGLRL